MIKRRWCQLLLISYCLYVLLSFFVPLPICFFETHLRASICFYSFSKGSNDGFVKVWIFKTVPSESVSPPCPCGCRFGVCWCMKLQLDYNSTTFCFLFIDLDKEGITSSGSQQHTVIFTVSLHTVIFWWINVRTSSNCSDDALQPIYSGM